MHGDSTVLQTINDLALENAMPSLTVSRSPLRCLATAAMVAVLAACGGDDDDPLDTDPSNDPVSKYIGSWETPCYTESSASAWARADFRKLSPDTLAGDVVAYAYAGKACSGPALRDRKVLSNMVATLVGTQMVGGVLADRFTGSSDQGKAHFLLFSNGDILLVGDPNSPEDADGYPTAFYEHSLTRMKR
jgi:hypothetical protein